MTENNENTTSDCLECRLVGGCSIILIAAYLWTQAKKRKKLEKTTILFISGGTFAVGLARLFNFIPRNTNKEKQKMESKNEI